METVEAYVIDAVQWLKLGVELTGAIALAVGVELPFISLHAHWRWADAGAAKNELFEQDPRSGGVKGKKAEKGIAGIGKRVDEGP